MLLYPSKQISVQTSTGAGTPMHHAAMANKKEMMFTLARLGCDWRARAEGIDGATAAFVLCGQHTRTTRQQVCIPSTHTHTHIQPSLHPMTFLCPLQTGTQLCLAVRAFLLHHPRAIDQPVTSRRNIPESRFGQEQLWSCLGAHSGCKANVAMFAVRRTYPLGSSVACMHKRHPSEHFDMITHMLAATHHPHLVVRLPRGAWAPRAMC